MNIETNNGKVILIVVSSTVLVWLEISFIIHNPISSHNALLWTGHRGHVFPALSVDSPLPVNQGKQKSSGAPVKMWKHKGAILTSSFRWAVPFTNTCQSCWWAVYLDMLPSLELIKSTRTRAGEADVEDISCTMKKKMLRVIFILKSQPSFSVHVLHNTTCCFLLPVFAPAFLAMP